MKINKIQKDISDEENKGIVLEGANAGMPSLRQLNPRTKKYDELARKSYQTTSQDKALTEEEREFKAAVDQYRESIDNYEQSEAAQNQNAPIGGDGDKILDDLNIEPMMGRDAQAGEAFLSNNDILQDFYKEMNTEIEDPLSRASKKRQQVTTNDF